MKVKVKNYGLISICSSYFSHQGVGSIRKWLFGKRILSPADCEINYFLQFLFLTKGPDFNMWKLKKPTKYHCSAPVNGAKQC